MIAANRFPRAQLDSPWRRLIWVTPSALLLWGVLLVGFALLLEGTRTGPLPIERLDARLIDLPPAQPAGGLQGDAKPESQPAQPPPEAALPPPQPQPHVEKKRAQPLPRPKKKQNEPPPVYDSGGTHTTQAIEEPGTAPPTSSAPGTSAANVGASGRGGGGIGADHIGARAIYAPTPTIPDDLRQDIFETVAVAHFRVGFAGDTKVVLTQPTSNPRLNVLLLDTLKGWRFFPAIRNGIAIDSEFDVRIPITVR